MPCPIGGEFVPRRHNREVIDLLKVLAAIDDPAKRRVVYNCAL
jgi:hypothetical protein